MTVTAEQAAATGRLVDLFEYGLDAPDLPDLGAHLRVQPRLRALPAARPGGATRPS